MQIDRRELLKGSSLLFAGMRPMPRGGFLGAPNALPAFYDEIERRTFRWFWDTVNRKNGLVPDRWPTPIFSSIAAVGFALPAYAIGVERGWCTRAEARDLTLTTLRFFWNAPQGPEPTGTSGYKGFFYHFLDMETGARFRDVELSSVDTDHPADGRAVRRSIFRSRRCRRAGNPSASRTRSTSAPTGTSSAPTGAAPISMGWHPERRPDPGQLGRI